MLAYGSEGGLTADWVERQTRVDLDWYKRRLVEQWDEEKAAIERAKKKK